MLLPVTLCLLEGVQVFLLDQPLYATLLLHVSYLRHVLDVVVLAVVLLHVCLLVVEGGGGRAALSQGVGLLRDGLLFIHHTLPEGDLFVEFVECLGFCR